MNVYGGERVRKGWKIDRIDPSSISPQDFFETYTSKRKPVILTSHLTDTEWKGARWTKKYLRKKAGEAVVQVEVRGSTKESFGNGKKVPMAFGDLLTKLEQASDHYYLTTQPLPEDADGPLALYTAPLEDLAGDFPLRPTLLGNLVPWQYNMWMGNASNGASTGLHHDFHDNLYVLMRGRKTFKLFSPDSADKLVTSGEVVKVHANGLINYQGCETRPDGVHPFVVGQSNRQTAEADLGMAETALQKLIADGGDKKLIQKAKKRVEEAEEALDAALDGAMNEEMGGFDDYVEEEGDLDEDDDSDCGADRGFPSFFGKKGFGFQKGFHKGGKFGDSPVFSDEEDDDNSRVPVSEDSAQSMKNRNDPAIPVNFVTQITPGALSTTVEVKRGEMLYLPAGWFHEVTSFTDSAHKDEGHLAFNFWFYPPVTEDFASPYSDDHCWRRYQSQVPATMSSSSVESPGRAGEKRKAPSLSSSSSSHSLPSTKSKVKRKKTRK